MVTLYISEFSDGTRSVSVTGWGREGLYVHPGESYSFAVPIDKMMTRRVKTPYQQWLKRVRRKAEKMRRERHGECDGAPA